MSAGDYLGRYLWYELMTSDPTGAQRFYTHVVGWGLQETRGLGAPYVMWTRGQTAIGGVMELPEQARQSGTPSHWMAYIGAPDLDGTVARATARGARVYVPPQEIPAAGRFAVLGDPQGAMFAMYAPSTPPATESEPPQIGDFSWHELVTTDHAAAFDFYQAIFGWQQTGLDDRGVMGQYRMFGRKGWTLGGMYNKPADVQAPPHWLLYIRVADIHSAAQAVGAHGGRVLSGPAEVPGGDWVVQCFDPQGALFALHARKSG